MEENVSLTIERLPEAQAKECLVTSRRQIQSFLRNISESGSRVALYYDGSKGFIMTSLLTIGEKGMWVEQSVDAPKNRQIAESKRITLVSSHNQVKIQFAVEGARVVTHQGYPAFYLPLPANLYRIQRREYFRLAIPLSERLRCNVPMNHTLAGGSVELPVMDISVGGIRLTCAEENIEFVIGQTYPGCQIELTDVGRIEVALRVKNLVSLSPKPGQTITRIGCEFVNLDNASAVLMQRYVTNMQRMRNDPQ